MRLARTYAEYVYEHEGQVYKAVVYWYSTGAETKKWFRLSNGQEVPLSDADAADIEALLHATE